MTPIPLRLQKICVAAGADSIVCHLREDRRHINDGDVKELRKAVRRLNLEMSLNEDIVRVACRVKPNVATLVPEKRQEVTTEGGLNVVKQKSRIAKVVQRLQKCGIAVSLFVDPVKTQVKAARETGATIIELHTGTYDRKLNKAARARELKKIKEAAKYAQSLGLIVSAGHGLKVHNAGAIAKNTGNG